MIENIVIGSHGLFATFTISNTKRSLDNEEVIL